MTLVDAVVRAQSGYRSDVAALKAELGRAEVFVPLEDQGQIREGLQTLKTDARVTIHNLRSGDGTAWIPLFTTLDALRAAGEQNGWTTGDGPLQFLSIKGMVALESMFAPAFESGANAGLVFDVGQPSELAIRAGEVLQILKGEPIPLVDYASRQPTRGTEESFVGWPAVPPPPELLDSIAGVLGTEQLVKSHAVRQVFIPERDVAPHLMLDISGEISDDDRRRISQRIGAAVSGIKLPPPGYLDVAFNFGGESE